LCAGEDRVTFKVFDERAKEYDSWFDKHDIIYENELTLIKQFPCESPCLEIGVGTGRFAAPLRIEVGVDPSLQELSIAASRGIEVVRGVAEHLPFRDGSFLTSYMVVTICFVTDPIESLNEATRVLKKGGRLVICVVPRDSEWGEFYEERKRKGESIFYRDAIFYTKKQLKDMLGGSGFKIERAASVLHFHPWEKAYVEEPSEGENGSFVCYEARKS
jgi:SAM-dependent methyltransferase